MTFASDALVLANMPPRTGEAITANGIMLALACKQEIISGVHVTECLVRLEKAGKVRRVTKYQRKDRWTKA